MHKLSIYITAAAGAILFAVAPVQAQTQQRVVVTGNPEALTARVSFADLNLSSPAGRNRLDARVRAAVRQVCPAGERMPLSDMWRSQECARAAQTEANGQIERIVASRG